MAQIDKKKEKQLLEMNMLVPPEKFDREDVLRPKVIKPDPMSSGQLPDGEYVPVVKPPVVQEPEESIWDKIAKTVQATTGSYKKQERINGFSALQSLPESRQAPTQEEIAIAKKKYSIDNKFWNESDLAEDIYKGIAKVNSNGDIYIAGEQIPRGEIRVDGGIQPKEYSKMGVQSVPDAIAGLLGLPDWAKGFIPFKGLPAPKFDTYKQKEIDNFDRSPLGVLGEALINQFGTQPGAYTHPGWNTTGEIIQGIGSAIGTGGVASGAGITKTLAAGLATAPFSAEPVYNVSRGTVTPTAASFDVALSGASNIIGANAIPKMGKGLISTLLNKGDALSTPAGIVITNRAIPQVLGAGVVGGVAIVPTIIDQTGTTDDRALAIGVGTAVGISTAFPLAFHGLTIKGMKDAGKQSFKRVTSDLNTLHDEFDLQLSKGLTKEEAMGKAYESTTKRPDFGRGVELPQDSYKQALQTYGEELLKIDNLGKNKIEFTADGQLLIKPSKTATKSAVPSNRPSAVSLEPQTGQMVTPNNIDDEFNVAFAKVYKSKNELIRTVPKQMKEAGIIPDVEGKVDSRVVHQNLDDFLKTYIRKDLEGISAEDKMKMASDIFNNKTPHSILPYYMDKPTRFTTGVIDNMLATESIAKKTSMGDMSQTKYAQLQAASDIEKGILYDTYVEAISLIAKDDMTFAAYKKNAKIKSREQFIKSGRGKTSFEIVDEIDDALKESGESTKKLFDNAEMNRKANEQTVTLYTALEEELKAMEPKPIIDDPVANAPKKAEGLINELRAVTDDAIRKEIISGEPTGSVETAQHVNRVIEEFKTVNPDNAIEIKSDIVDLANDIELNNPSIEGAMQVQTLRGMSDLLDDMGVTQTPDQTSAEIADIFTSEIDRVQTNSIEAMLDKAWMIHEQAVAMEGDHQTRIDIMLKAKELGQRAMKGEDVSDELDAISPFTSLSQTIKSNTDLQQKLGGLALGIGSLFIDEDDDGTIDEAGLSPKTWMLLAGASIVGASIPYATKAIRNIRNKPYLTRVDADNLNELLESVTDAVPYVTKGDVARSIVTIKKNSPYAQAIRETDMDEAIKADWQRYLEKQAIGISSALDKVYRSWFGKSPIVMGLVNVSLDNAGVDPNTFKVDVPVIENGMMTWKNVDVSPKAYQEVRNTVRGEMDETAKKIKIQESIARQKSGGEDGYTMNYATNIKLYAEAVELDLALKESQITKEEYTERLADLFSDENWAKTVAENMQKHLAKKYPVGSSKYNALLQNAVNGKEDFIKTQRMLTKAQIDAKVYGITGETYESLKRQEPDLLLKKEQYKTEMKRLRKAGLLTSTVSRTVKFSADIELNKLRVIKEADKAIKRSSEMGHVDGFSIAKAKASDMTRVHELVQDPETGQWGRRGEYGQHREVYYYSGVSHLEKGRYSWDLRGINPTEGKFAWLNKRNAVKVEGTDYFEVDRIDIHGNIVTDESGNTQRVVVEVIDNNLHDIKINARLQARQLEPVINKFLTTNTFSKHSKKLQDEDLKALVDEVNKIRVHDDSEESILLKDVKDIVKDITKSMSSGEQTTLHQKLLQVSKLGQGSIWSPTNNSYGGAKAMDFDDLKVAALNTTNVMIEGVGDVMLSQASRHWLNNTIGYLDGLGLSPKNLGYLHYIKSRNVLDSPSASGIWDSPIGSLDFAKWVASAAQLMTLPVLMLNPASYVRSTSDAFKMSVVTGAYGDRINPASIFVGTSKKMLTTTAKASAIRLKSKLGGEESLRKSLEYNPYEVGTLNADIYDAGRGIATEGVSAMMAKTFWNHKILDGAYMLLRFGDWAFRRSQFDYLADRYVKKNPFNPEMFDTPEDLAEAKMLYINNLRNDVGILVNATSGRVKPSDLNPNFAWIKKNPYGAALGSIMWYAYHNMGVMAALGRSAFLEGDKNTGRAVASLIGLAGVSTLLSGLSMPVLKDIWDMLRFAEDTLGSSDKGKLDMNGQDRIKASLVTEMMKNGLSAEDAEGVMEVFEYGAVSYMTGRNLSADDALFGASPFIGSRLTDLTKAFKDKEPGSGLSRFIANAILPTAAKNIWGALAIATDDAVPRWDRRSSTNVNYTGKDYFMHVALGEPLDAVKERKNKFYTSNPIDTQKEKEDFINRIASRAGTSIDGADKTKTKKAYGKNKFLRDRAAIIWSQIEDKSENMETLGAISKSEDAIRTWAEENRQLIIDKMTYESESATYSLNFNAMVDRLVAKSTEYYMNFIVMEVMNDMIKQSGSDLPLFYLTKTVDDIEFGKQGFHFVTDNYGEESSSGNKRGRSRTRPKRGRR